MVNGFRVIEAQRSHSSWLLAESPVSGSVVGAGLPAIKRSWRRGAAIAGKPAPTPRMRSARHRRLLDDQAFLKADVYQGGALAREAYTALRRAA